MYRILVGYFDPDRRWGQQRASTDPLTRGGAAVAGSLP